MDARAEADNAFRHTAEQELRADFGPDYTPNLNAVKNLLASMPEATSENFLAGRPADGRRIGDSPASSNGSRPSRASLIRWRP